MCSLPLSYSLGTSCRRVGGEKERGGGKNLMVIMSFVSTAKFARCRCSAPSLPNTPCFSSLCCDITDFFVRTTGSADAVKQQM